MTPAGYFWTTYLTALTIGGLSLLDIAPRLIWNASASVPVGFYTLRDEPQPLVGDLVVVEPPCLPASSLSFPRGPADRHHADRGLRKEGSAQVRL